ncbi:MAG: hypothetical protein ACFFD4_33125 [Candidatus Odinarchaeota archaeon]
MPSEADYFYDFSVDEQGKRVLELETITGRKIGVTNDLQIMTEHGWIRADKLGLDSKVLIFPSLLPLSLDDFDCNGDFLILDTDSFLNGSWKKNCLKKNMVTNN